MPSDLQDVRQAVQDDGEAGAMMSKFRDRLTMETTAVFASSRLLDDGVIYPQDTRHVSIVWRMGHYRAH